MQTGLTHAQTCTRCLLGNADTEFIEFNEQGVCSYCTGYDKTIRAFNSHTDSPEKRLNALVSVMKTRGRGKKYDCILGLSGGTDSSYLAWWANQQGLRPLVVHMDNGWNSELAVKNIENICTRLGWDLHTHVIDWEEFRELQLSYLRAGVIDIEALTDHAIYAIIYKLARKYRIKYTLSGYNYATEAIMPKGWTYNKRDYENIQDIYRHFGRGKTIKTFPHLSFWGSLWYHWFLKIENINVLNYLPYQKEEAKKIISAELGWRDYGGKHFESVFTKFYQIYILPLKFGVDKRKCHLSNLICSGQITKEQALEEMNKPLYDQSEINEEKHFVLKKFGLSEQEFEEIMKGPVRSHESFRTNKELWRRYFKVVGAINAFLKAIRLKKHGAGNYSE
jgi:N-acetyl sugar amidotransferase